MLGIYAVNLSADLPEEVFQKFIGHLPAERQKKVRAFLRRADALRSLVAQMMLRLTIIELLQIPNGEQQFDFNQYGKPALVYPGSFHFNLSHAGDWVALITDADPVGIDVERVKQVDLDLARRFFSPREYEDLMALPPEEREEYFFELWTLKESYIKAVGMGLSLSLASFSMVREGPGFRIVTEREGSWFFQQYPLAPGYKFAVCRVHDEFPREIEVLDLNGLYARYRALEGWFA